MPRSCQAIATPPCTTFTSEFWSFKLLPPRYIRACCSLLQWRQLWCGSCMIPVSFPGYGRGAWEWDWQSPGMRLVLDVDHSCTLFIFLIHRRSQTFWQYSTCLCTCLCIVYRARPILSLAGSWGRPQLPASERIDRAPLTSSERENWSSSID